MTVRVQQLLPVVLAMDVEQLPPQLPKLGHRQRPSVHPADIAAISLNFALKHQFLFSLKSIVLQPL